MFPDFRHRPPGWYMLFRTTVFALFLTILGAGLHAQTRAQIEQLRQNPQLVRQLIQQSGMTPTQIRQQLEIRGYDPGLLDRFLNSTSGGAADPASLDALSELGIDLSADGLETIPLLTGAVGGFPPFDEDSGLAVFGQDVFTRTTQFQPVLSGPVPPGYRLGPGDVLSLVITGDVQLVHQLEVGRDGAVLIPNVGQLLVNNLTMEQLDTALRERLITRYSRIRTGQTRYSVSVSNIRVNQVFVLGEVMRPGAYQLASVATTLNALYAAGGPNELGSLRAVQVRRRDSVVATLDFYDYLLSGSTADDIVLEQGDVVFVPIATQRVSVTGAVRREAQFDLREGETLADLLAVSGGLRSDALRERIAIHRLLPGAERQPGLTRRMVMDVPLDASTTVPVVPLFDGDSVVVDSLPTFNRALTVRIAGLVIKPARYPWHEGMTLRDLVFLARGPSVGASLQEAEVARLPDDRTDGRLAEIIRVPLDSSYLFQRGLDGRYVGPAGQSFPAPGSANEFVLQPFDQITILRQPGFELQRTVSIDGEVRFPGKYALTRKDERVSDLVQRAGGLLQTAYSDGARFFRELDSAGRVNLELNAALQSPAGAGDLILQPGDSLHIPEYTPTVRVEGAVNAPTSVLFVEGEGIDYYVDNAGGFTREADKGRVAVQYANGSADVRRRRLLLFSSSPTPGPGSTISVPTKPSSIPLNVVQLLGVSAQILGSAVAIIAVLNR